MNVYEFLTNMAKNLHGEHNQLGRDFLCDLANLVNASATINHHQAEQLEKMLGKGYRRPDFYSDLFILATYLNSCEFTQD